MEKNVTSLQNLETLDDHSAQIAPIENRVSDHSDKIGLIGAASLLSACGGGGGSNSGGGGAISPPPPPPPTITTQEAARFLLQAQFSANDPDINSIKSQGFAPWLAAQMNLPVPQTGVEWLNSKNYFTPTSDGNYFNSVMGDHMIFSQLIGSPQQMRMRLALALSNFFVVSLSSFDGFWPPYFIANYWDKLTGNVFGNFRTILDQITLDPAMGRFLNTAGNKKENPISGSVPDENYAREVMQLFTIGLHELNLDGTDKTDLSGQAIETYSQSDITNLARVFTGFELDYSKVRNQTVSWLPYPVPTPEFALSQMALNPFEHSPLAVSFLGTTIPANTPALEALKTALDTLFNHPNVAPFFAKQMIQRLVTSNPSPNYVRRVAQAFVNNGAGVRGDLKAVWTAILTDVEARPQTPSNTFGRLREPVVRFIQWARTFNATSSNGNYQIYDLSRADQALGQSPLRAPSVFNFFRPGYVPPKTAASSLNLVAPEFQIHNETSIAGYMNFMSQTIPFGYLDVKANYDNLLDVAHDSSLLLAWLNIYLSADQLSPSTVTLIKNALDATGLTSSSSPSAKRERIWAAILMVMSAPEYLIQK